MILEVDFATYYSSVVLAPIGLIYPLLKTGLQSYQQIPQQQQQRTSSLFVVKLDRHTACLTVAKGDASIASGSLSNPTLVASSESIFNDAAGSTSTASTEPTIDHADSLSWRPTCLEELQATFTPKIAYMAYIPLCRLAGIQL